MYCTMTIGHRSHPLLKKLNLDPTEPYGDTPPESSTRAASSGVTEDAPSPGSCSDERVELTDYGLWGTAVYQLPISVKEHTPVAHRDNPLNPQNVEAVADTLSGFGRMDIHEPSKKMKKSRKKFNSENLGSPRKLSVVEAYVIGATTHDFAFHPSLVPSAKPIETSHGNGSSSMWKTPKAYPGDAGYIATSASASGSIAYAKEKLKGWPINES
ncbi:hypothetical protein JB92DRAFT_3306256 [Gautieria morchelliformis]|nr:hypothetical protein JB92DRAFT_3306256 [Gautieria morchelliformis]